MYIPVDEAMAGICPSSKKRGFMIIPPPIPKAEPAIPVTIAIILIVIDFFAVNSVSDSWKLYPTATFSSRVFLRSLTTKKAITKHKKTNTKKAAQSAALQVLTPT